MALSIAEQYTQAPTYDSLCEMLKIYLNRRDQATLDVIPFFINAAEKVMLRNLRMPSMERLVKFNVTNVLGGYIDLPVDYLEMKFVWTEGDNPGTLQRVPFDQILRGSPVMSTTSTSLNGGGNVTTNDTYMIEDADYNSGYWAINGTRLYFCGVTTEELMFNYFVDVVELRPDSQSNILLTLVPDAFLYLAVAEGWKFLMEPEKSQYWENFGMQRLMAVQAQVDEAEFSGSPLTITPV